MTPPPAPQSANLTAEFWQSLGQHLAVITVEVGEQVGLAFLSGFLSKKLGTTVNISIPPSA